MGLFSFSGARNCFNFLSEVSIIAKHNQEEFSKDWRYFIDLQNIGGYQEVDSDKFRDDVLFWIQGKTRFGQLPGFYGYVDRALDELYDNIDFGVDVEDPTIEEFLNCREDWGKSGGLLLRNFRKWKRPKGVKNTKSNFATLAAKEQIEKEFYMSGGQSARAIPKYEFSKVRAIINSDLTAYLQMSYFSKILEKLLTNIEGIAYTYTEDRRIKMETDIVESLNNGFPKYPIDQSKSDHKPDKKFIIHLVKFLRVIWNKKSEHSKEAENTWDNLIFGLENCIVDVEGEKYIYEKGLLSGWRWTTMLVTLTNYVELKVCEYLFKDIVGRSPFRNFEALGDDDRLELYDERDVYMINLIYHAMGLEVNPKKTFVSYSTDEFLRKVYLKDTVTGYPARILGSILYNKREPPDKLTAMSRVDSNISNWWLAMQRGCDYNKIMRLMVTDLSGLLNKKRSEIEEYLEMSVAIKGPGIGDSDSGYLFKYKTQSEIPDELELPVDVKVDYEKDQIARFIEERFGEKKIIEVEEKYVSYNIKRIPFGLRPGRGFNIRANRISYEDGHCISPSNFVKFDDNGRLHRTIREKLSAGARPVENRLFRVATKNFYHAWCKDKFDIGLPRLRRLVSSDVPVFYGGFMEMILQHEISRYRPSLGNLRNFVGVAAELIRNDSSSISYAYLS
jgi:hypothetical protein